MKFSVDGPEIPDGLLLKRDAGNVVFICGAGVSASRAGLPGFETLASDVMDELRVPDDHEARKILSLSEKEENRGLISIDKVFGELEHKYYTPDITAAVTKLLYSKGQHDTSCHKIMLDLATSPDGTVRLVTTNFDNLFSQVTNVKEWVLPGLPSAREMESLDGLVYLHGKCDKEDNPEDIELVLSTSSFGDAYLADGKAREFLKYVLEKFTVVFVGYSADDPPMQYLLEALAKSQALDGTAYAFHKGEQSEAEEKWRHRGVIPLCYKDHEDLWETLEHWRNRAFDINLWATQIVEIAQLGPYRLKNWQRSQVADLVSNPVGAEIIAKSEKPIPPQWLFVFDPKFRYATRKKGEYLDDEIVYPDPFDILGLEKDSVPNAISPDDYYTRREVPPDAWNAFEVSSDDAMAEDDRRYYKSSFHAFSSVQVPVPDRLKNLAIWIGRIAKYPITLRWATHQLCLHPYVVKKIQRSLDSDRENVSPVIQRSWEILFEIWNSYDYENEAKLLDLNRKVNQLGWHYGRILNYRNLSMPKLAVAKLERADELFLSSDVPRDLEYITPLNVEYYGKHCAFDATDEHIFDILEIDRNNLIRAIEIEKKLNRYGNQNLPIVLSKKNFDDPHNPNNNGIKLLFVRYYRRFMNAYEISRERCKDEFEVWPKSDTNVFERLRILVAGSTGILTPAKAGDFLSSVSQDIFWDRYHKGDIVNSIRLRWSEFSPSTKKKIEKRILDGAKRWNNENDEEYKMRNARYTLDVLQWLLDKNCKFDIDYAKTIRRLRKKCPTWEKSFSINIDKNEELTIERGSVDNESLSMGGDMAKFYLLTTLSDSEKEIVDVDDIIEFIRMCEKRPSKAFRMIAASARQGEYFEWMWRYWLQSNWNEDRCKRYLWRTAVFLCKASNSQIAEMKSSVYNWFRLVASSFALSWHDLRYSVSLRLLDALKEYPDAAESEIVRTPGRKVDWVFEANNSPIGHLVDAVCRYPDILSFGINSQPPQHFVDIASDLLELKGDAGRFSLVSFVLTFPHIYPRFPKWVSSNVVSRIQDSDVVTKEAYFESLSYVAGNINAHEIFLEIRDAVISAFNEHVSMSDGVVEQLSGMIIRGWITPYDGDRLVNDSQFRKMLSLGSESFRESILSHLCRWLKEDSDSSTVKCREIMRFFSDIWPLGRFAVSQRTNLYMLEIAFSSEHLFSFLIPIIKPRLEEVDVFDIELGDLDHENSKIIKTYPEVLLDVLSSTLPKDAVNWYTDLGKVFDTIEKLAPHLTKDRRLSNLRKKRMS